jgi:DNA-binding MarR family transcriptional regulator
MGSPGDPRWLDTEQQVVWRSWLSVTKSMEEHLDRQLQHDSGITLGDYVLLVQLSEAPGRALRMSELAEATVYSRSRLSHAARRLEEAGWIYRTTCDEDGRGTLAHLTDEGFAVLAAAAPGHATAVHDLVFDAIGTSGTVALGKAMAAIADRLAAGTDSV